MDTPERTSQIGTPIAKIEESPFSNFANSLSPINAIKTLHVSQTLSSLSFTSPPSVFTSPHVSLQKESRFLRRHQAVDLVKTHFSCDEGNQDSQAGQAISADEKQPDLSTNEQVRGEGVSGSEAAAESLCNVSDCPTELQNILKYDSGSPDSKAATSRGVEQNCEADASGSLVPYAQEPPADSSFGAELNSQERDIDNEETACEWQSLISVTTDLFIFDSPNDAATLKGSFHKSLEEETNVFASLLSRFPPNDSNDVQNSNCAGPINFNEDQEATNQAAIPTETNELKQTDQQPGNLSMSSLNRYLSGDSGEKSGDELFPHMQRGMRRRCLTFEMPKANSSNNVIFSSSSSSLQNEEKSLPNDRQPCIPTDSSRCLVSGFGLHLNKVTHLSKECIASHQDTPSPTNQEPPMKLSASTSSEKNVSPAESGLQLVEYSSQASTNVVTEELNPNSPKKKRRKFENVGEVEGCKRCNCKKSKCLKLYCECFAAGVYCVEPCSCQECFNKPIHEDTVLATRKQIESRNPLAFAPKVIRTSDSAQDFGQEDSTKTPASARHKRGCNCKKSNCLKKYCECYQGGVGCSISCRCEGCKNAFGRKDGLSVLGSEAEMEETAQASEKHVMDKSSDPPAFRSDEDQSSDFNPPITPLRVFRPSVPVSTSSKGKPPRSLVTIGSSMSLHPIDGLGRSTFLRSQTKIHQKHFHGASGEEIPTVLQNCSSPPSSGVKTLSPNGKRVSPPNHSKGQSPVLRSSRKLILQSIPSFPSLTPRR